MTIPVALEPVGRKRLPDGARLVVTAAWASNIGDGIRCVALPLLAATVTTNATAIGAVVGATMHPGAILGAPVGVVIDRLDRRRIALVSDLARIGIAVAVLGTILTDTTTITMVIAAAALLGIGETFRDLAGGALIADAVDDKDLEAANGSLIVAEVAGNTMLGPVAGSALWAAARAVPFALDAGALAVSAYVTRKLGNLTARTAPASQGPRPKLRAELAAAWRYTWANVTLRRILLTSTVLQTMMMFVIGVEVIWALDRLDIGALGLGAINATIAAGGIIAGTATKRFDLAAKGRSIITGAIAVLAVAILGYTSTNLALVFICLFAGGAALIIGDIVLRAARVRAAGTDWVGRGTGVIRTAMWAGGSAGAVAGGAVAQHHGIVATFTTAAVTLAGLAAATAIWPPVPSATSIGG
jgi:hypothetical protein